MTRSLLIVTILALFGSLAGAPAAVAQDDAPASSTITPGLRGTPFRSRNDR